MPAGAEPLEQHIGRRLKALRKQQKLTIADVSQQAQMSGGMLSKIENGQASTSLDMLSRLTRTLGVSLSQVFADFDTPEGSAQLVKAGAGMEVVRRGTKRGHDYRLLAYDKGPRKRFEPFLVSMDDASEVFPRFEHPGTEFLFLLAGRLVYRHGQHTYDMAPGDALTFRGEVPHGPETLIETPIRLLSIIVYPDE
jgi:transcriptional regulator with XRE-family HTH domain